MTESEVIECVDLMTPIDKLKIYMDYFVGMLYLKYTSETFKEYGVTEWKAKTYDEFCSESNAMINGPHCDDWKERGFASKSWFVLNPASIYHHIHHNTKLVCIK